MKCNLNWQFPPTLSLSPSFQRGSLSHKFSFGVLHFFLALKLDRNTYTLTSIDSLLIRGFVFGPPNKDGFGHNLILLFIQYTIQNFLEVLYIYTKPPKKRAFATAYGHTESTPWHFLLGLEYEGTFRKKKSDA